MSVTHTPGPWVVKIQPNDRFTGSAHYTVENPTFDGPCECGGKHPPGRLIAWLAGGLGDADLFRRRPESARHDPSTEADARLIAAAPDLLEALKEADRLFTIYGLVVGHVEGEPWACGRWINSARSAIAKAEGRS